MIKTPGGDLKAVDFEFSHVTYAGMDLGLPFRIWLRGGQKKRRYIEAYLKALGEDSSPESVDLLLLDAEYAALGSHCGPVLDEMHRGDNPRYIMRRLQEYKVIIQEAVNDEVLREDIIENGLSGCVRGKKLEDECRK